MAKIPYNPLDVANYIIWRANAIQKPVTHLKLQKLLYYVVAKFAKDNNRLLINENIVKWQYGPVVKSVYHQFKLYGSQEIMAPVSYLSDESNYSGQGEFIIKFVDTDEKNKLLHQDKSLNDTVGYILAELGDYTAFQLVNKTHSECAWKNFETDILKNSEQIYSIQELQAANI